MGTQSMEPLSASWLQSTDTLVLVTFKYKYRAEMTNRRTYVAILYFCLWYFLFWNAVFFGTTHFVTQKFTFMIIFLLTTHPPKMSHWSLHDKMGIEVTPNEINFCRHEISFLHVKLFLLSKLAKTLLILI